MIQAQRVTLAPGAGVLARRVTDLVFLPAPSEPLLDAYWHAPAESVIEAVADRADELSFDVPPFVVVTWVNDLRLALFGDVEVTSNQRSLERLSAAGTGTWIERTVRSTPVVFGVNSIATDPATDLRAGVVLAGGFALFAVDGDATAPSEPSSTAARREEPEPEHTPESEPERTAEPVEIPIVDVVGTPDDPTIDVPDRVDAPIAAAWRLRFADGPTVEIDQPVLIGREPVLHDGDEATRTVAVDCPRISGRHLLVVAAENKLFATDLGSRNHSWLVSSADQQLVQLEPHVATEIVDGSHLQIGSRVFVVEWIPDSPQ